MGRFLSRPISGTARHSRPHRRVNLHRPDNPLIGNSRGSLKRRHFVAFSYGPAELMSKKNENAAACGVKRSIDILPAQLRVKLQGFLCLHPFRCRVAVF
jgi:hypothetical protein